MFESICVVGAGCVGEAAAARLAGQVPTRSTGRELDCGDADLVLLCVPDRAIAEVAAAVPRGPWVAHTSGAVSVTRLEPHRRRFALHPLQTFQRGLGPGQFDGAFGALTAEAPRALEAGHALAALLGLRTFELADEHRPAYHAAATMAASFLVTLQRAACGPDGGGGGAAGGARAAHAADDRERLPADRPVRARRLRDGRVAPSRDRAPAPAPRAALRRARERDGDAGTQ